MSKMWRVNFRINEEAYGKGRKAPLISKYVPASMTREQIYEWVINWCRKNLGTNFDFRITSVKLVEVEVGE